MKIKLCGFNNLESIKYVLKYHPDFIGFIFYPSSKRNITLDQAKDFSKLDFGKSKKVAVIVNENDDNITKIIYNLQPDLLQLHGDESVKRCSEIKEKFKLPIIKAIAISDSKNLQISKINKKIEDYQKIVNFLLFDTKVSEKGGSGKIFNWNILNKLNLQKDYFLSGGINLNNINEASKTTNTKNFDLSSGIEEEKGIKSLNKIKNLMEFFNEFKKI